jgi:tetratricopeptide (TPR) repeat protein
MNISACLIVKNEESNLERCINSFKEFVDETIVVDTGSTDKTREIAKGLGAKVYSYPWDGNFSNPRNYALDNAKYDWVIFLDADEYFNFDTGIKIRNILKNVNNKDIDSILCKRVNIELSSGKVKTTDFMIRIFRANKKIRYKNRIHENIYNGDELLKPIMIDDIVIYHTGYSSEILPEKVNRNIKILLQDVEEGLENKLTDYYLADSYFTLKKYDLALKHAEKYLRNPSKNTIGFFTKPYLIIIKSIIEIGFKHDYIITMINESIKKFPNQPEFYVLLAIQYISKGHFKNSLDAFKMTLELQSKYNDIESNEVPCILDNVYYNIGCIYDFKGNYPEAIENYFKALKENKNHKEAFGRLISIVRNENTEDIIVLLNNLYDKKDINDIKILVNLLALYKVSEILMYYANIWVNTFKQEDFIYMLMLLCNKQYQKAFELFSKCYEADQSEWIQQNYLISAILSENEINVGNAKLKLNDSYKKISELYYVSSEKEISTYFTSNEVNLYINIIKQIIPIADNGSISKFISLKHYFTQDISNAIGDCFFEMKKFEEALEQYFQFVDNCKESNELADTYYKIGIIFYKLNNEKSAVEYFENAINLGYEKHDIYEYLNWSMEKCSCDSLTVKILKLINEENKHNKIKLNIGCGKNIISEWINIDNSSLPGVDVIADLDECDTKQLPFNDDTVDELLASHVLEHIKNTLSLMQELHRIAKPNAKFIIRVPYGSSDDAYEDPTHIRKFFMNSFGYFSQPFYWRADYGYMGDWLTKNIILIVDKDRFINKHVEEIMYAINTYRNVVKEMIVELVAIKPIREPNRELQNEPKITITLG